MLALAMLAVLLGGVAVLGGLVLFMVTDLTSYVRTTLVVVPLVALVFLGAFVPLIGAELAGIVGALLAVPVLTTVRSATRQLLTADSPPVRGS